MENNQITWFLTIKNNKLSRGYLEINKRKIATFALALLIINMTYYL